MLSKVRVHCYSNQNPYKCHLLIINYIQILLLKDSGVLTFSKEVRSNLIMPCGRGLLWVLALYSYTEKELLSGIDIAPY